MIQIFYGYGKGKTSTLNGMALRAKGANFKVGYFRFLKGRLTSENKMFKKLDIDFFNYHSGTKFVFQMNDEEKKIIQNETNHAFVEILAKKNHYDLILIDEFLDLVTTKLKTEQELINLIKNLQRNSLEIALSGHNPLPNLFKKANLITHFKKEKHYFDNGLNARKGIEF